MNLHISINFCLINISCVQIEKYTKSHLCIVHSLKAAYNTPMHLWDLYNNFKALKSFLKGTKCMHKTRGEKGIIFTQCYLLFLLKNSSCSCSYPQMIFKKLFLHKLEGILDNYLLLYSSSIYTKLFFFQNNEKFHINSYLRAMLPISNIG